MSKSARIRASCDAYQKATVRYQKPALQEFAQPASTDNYQLNTKLKSDIGDIEDIGPPHWREVYALVAEMRSKIETPVDKMGCAVIPECESIKTQEQKRFHILITLMLSAQTRDETNFAVMANLREACVERFGEFGVWSIRKFTEAELDSIIKPVGFHTRKANFIKRTCDILVEKHNGDIPVEVKDMIALPGVGPKMAYLLRSAAFGIDEGIGVDTHVHRLANMWGWVPNDGRPSPEKTRVALESWLPRKLWHDINFLLVGFGQTICPSRRPKCETCTLAPTGWCKGAYAQTKATSRNVKSKQIPIKQTSDATDLNMSLEEDIKEDVKEDIKMEQFIQEGDTKTPDGSRYRCAKLHSSSSISTGDKGDVSVDIGEPQIKLEST